MTLRVFAIPEAIHGCHNLSNGKSQQVVSAGLSGWQASEMPEGFGERLRAAMQKKQWNNRELAANAGLTEGAVSRHLERPEPPRTESVEKYRVALGVSFSWLAYGRDDAAPAQPTVEGPLRGSEALERVLARYEWPDVDIAIVDQVCADARAEAFSNGKDRPESAWHLRVKQLVRERTAPDKSVPQREPAVAVDLTQESPEVQAVRKRPRRL